MIANNKVKIKSTKRIFESGINRDRDIRYRIYEIIANMNGTIG